jgi:restriction system protein
LEATEGLQAWYERSRAAKKSKTDSKVDEDSDNALSDQTPDELIADAHQELSNSVASELIDLLHGEQPEFLEHAVLKVLHAMGYGSSIDDLQHLGRSGDGGVDGVINQDRLGLDQIYVQAKRNDPTKTIGRPGIQNFVGAVTGMKATRGIFITTSKFSPDARTYVKELSAPRIILIDGDDLAKNMLEHEIGVTVEKTYKVYRIDENFFDS